MTKMMTWVKANETTAWVLGTLLVVAPVALALVAYAIYEGGRGYREYEQRWHDTMRGAVIVRVCRDGTRIFKTSDHRYVDERLRLYDPAWVPSEWCS